MDKIKEGHISFSCIGKFIQQANISGNNIQGDSLEGVFAKLKKDDERIADYYNKLGKDLEIIAKDDYVYLRRKSSKLIPIFCLYSYKARDIISENNIRYPGIQKLNHTFDKRMYSGFSNVIDIPNVLNPDRIFTQLAIRPGSFVDRIKEAGKISGNRIESRNVNYEFFAQEQFCLNLNDKYEELFYKFPEYSYQHESRIILPFRRFHSISERYELNLSPFNEGDIYETHVPLYLEFMADIKESGI